MYGRGEVEFEELWDSYRMNLELVLEEVRTLLSNLDAETVVITADHGNAVGELRMYGHPAGFLHPAVRKVPWIETTATDQLTYEPSVGTESDERDVGELLEALGYA